MLSKDKFDYVIIHYTCSGEIDLLKKQSPNSKYIGFSSWLESKDKIKSGSMAAEYVDRMLDEGYDFVMYDWESLEEILK